MGYHCHCGQARRPLLLHNDDESGSVRERAAEFFNGPLGRSPLGIPQRAEHNLTHLGTLQQN
jgi:hypothetical protein